MIDDRVLQLINQLVTDMEHIKAEVAELKNFKNRIEMELNINWTNLHNAQQITNDKIDTLNSVIDATFASLSQTLNYVISKMETMPGNSTKFS